MIYKEQTYTKLYVLDERGAVFRDCTFCQGLVILPTIAHSLFEHCAFKGVLMRNCWVQTFRDCQFYGAPVGLEVSWGNQLLAFPVGACVSIQHEFVTATTFDSCYFGYGAKHGIRCSGSGHFRISVIGGCMEGITECAIWTRGFSRSWLVQGVTFEQNPIHIRAEGGTNGLSIRDNLMMKCAQAIQLSNCWGTVVEGNTFGEYAASKPISALQCTDIRYTSNNTNGKFQSL